MIKPEPVPPAPAFAVVAGESIPVVAERFLERRGEDLMDTLSFADDCQAFAFVTRFGQCAHERMPHPPRITAGAINSQTLRDQVGGEKLTPKHPQPPANSPRPSHEIL